LVDDEVDVAYAEGVDALLEEQAYSPGWRRKKKASMIMSAMA
jgi:hypothetical protein